MSHPISNIIRLVTNDYLPENSSEKLYYFIEKSNRVTDEKPKFISRFFSSFQSYIVNYRGSARGEYKLNWESLEGDILKLKIAYNCKCPHINTEQAVRILQDGPSPGYVFEDILQHLCEDFFDEQLDLKIDGVEDFFALQDSGKTIEQELEEYLSKEIESQIGLNVRSLSLKADHELELQEIKYPEEPFLEAKNKEFTKSIFYTFDLELKPAKGREKIYAITRHNQSVKFLPLVHTVVKDYLLDDFSHHTFISDKNTVNAELTGRINAALQKYGRVVKYFDLKIKDVVQKDSPPLDLLVLVDSIKVDGFNDPIIVNSKVAASVQDFGRFISIEDQYEFWLKTQVTSILENELIGFKTYREVLHLQFIEKEKFLADFQAKLQERADKKGVRIDDLGVSINSHFEFPELKEPIKHMVHCDIKNSDKLIVFGNTVHISITDKVKYIDNFEEHDLKDWAAKKLDKIVKGEIEFKNYKQVTLESIPKGKALEEKTNYKSRIEEKFEAATKKIGGKVKQILILPELTPLKWLEEFTVSINDQEFKTAKDGVPVRLSLRLSCRINDLSRLSDELLSPYGSIDAEIVMRIEEVLTKKLLETSSEDAYLEFYESAFNDESVEEQLKRMIIAELKQKFTAEVSYVNIQANSTPLVELYKDLRRGNHAMKVPIVNRTTLQTVTITFVFEIFGIANWNTFKVKRREAEGTINEVKKIIESSLVAKLEMVDLQDILANDEGTRRRAEEQIQIHVDSVVGKRLGLHVRLFDYSREQTKIELARLEARGTIVGELAADELEEERRRRQEEKEATEGLRDEKKRIEAAVKHGVASPEKIARLEEINKELSKRSATYTNLDTNNQAKGTEQSNSIENIFDNDVSQLKSGEDE